MWFCNMLCGKKNTFLDAAKNNLAANRPKNGHFWTK